GHPLLTSDNLFHGGDAVATVTRAARLSSASPARRTTRSLAAADQCPDVLGFVAVLEQLAAVDRVPPVAVRQRVNRSSAGQPGSRTGRRAGDRLARGEPESGVETHDHRDDQGPVGEPHRRKGDAGRRQLSFTLNRGSLGQARPTGRPTSPTSRYRSARRRRAPWWRSGPC